MYIFYLFMVGTCMDVEMVIINRVKNVEANETTKETEEWPKSDQGSPASQCSVGGERSVYGLN